MKSCKCTTGGRTSLVAVFAAACALALPAHAVWTYDSGTKTITKDGVSLAVGVWKDTQLSIADNTGRSDLVEIDLSDGIEDAGGKAYTIRQINGKAGFAGCTNLRRFVMGDETQSIGENNFKDCTALEEFVMGASCDSVGWDAFNGCTALSTFKVPANSALKTLNKGSFTGCASLASFAFENCPDLASVNNSAFNGCSSLAAADLSHCPRLETLGDNVFNGCTALSTVVFAPDCPIAKIGTGDFQNCTSLVAVDLSVCSNLTTIVGSAFRGCTSLSRVDMPESLTSLAKDSFAYHGSLASEGVAMLHVWFRSCPVADSAKTPFSHMFSSAKDYTVTDDDMANSSVTIHVPRAQASAGSPNWNTYAGDWQTLADASMSWKTDAAKKVFSLPDAPDGETVWVTDWRKTGNTDNDAAVRVVFRDDPIQVEVSGPEYSGAFVGRDFGTASFTAKVLTYDVDGADYVKLTITLHSDAEKTQVAAIVSHDVSALGAATPFAFSGLAERTTYYATLSGVDSAGNAGGDLDLGSFTTKWDEDVWTYHPDKGTLEKGWIVVKNVTASGTALTIANGSNNGDAEIPDLDFTGGIRDGYELVSVGNNAFQGCSALTNAVLPDTVIRVGDRAFYECPALANFVAEGPVAIGVFAFNADGKTSSLRTVRIPNVVEIGDRAFKSNTLLETLGSDLHALRTIGYQEALANLPNLEGEFVLTNLVSIGSNSWAFNGDKKVTSIVLGPGVSTWPVRTFGNMTGLTNLVFQGAVASLGYSALVGHGPYGGAAETLHVYLTSVPETFGGDVFGSQFWNGNMAGLADDASLMVVHIPWYQNVAKGREAADGTTETFAEWARAWQDVTAESLTAANCATTKFELPASSKALGVWRNDTDKASASAFIMRLAYYRDPDRRNAATVLFYR